MLTPPLPSDEPARLAELNRCDILDTSTEPFFDYLVKIAARLFNVPIAAITFIDDNKAWFKARLGTSLTAVSRDIAFGSYTILSDSVLVVPDARLDERFFDNPLVTGAPFISFYAGTPITTTRGFCIGCLEIMDRFRFRHGLDAEQQELLRSLAAIAAHEIDNRLAIEGRNRRQNQTNRV